MNLIVEKRRDHIQLKIGEVVISAVREPDCLPLSVDSANGKFRTANERPDVVLNVHCGKIPDFSPKEPVFESGGPWSLYRYKDRYLIALVSSALGPEPHRLAILDGTLSSGDLISQPEEIMTDSGVPALAEDIDPFEYPLVEILMINILGRKRLGVILHACGIIDRGQGIIFCGVSGAGKSTLAELWKRTDVSVLSDDRIIIRRVDGDFRMFGTPWHGDARIASPESAPLERLFFLQHAPTNYIKPITPAAAAACLLVRCFPPFYDPEGMQNTLDLLAQIAEETPCYELGFVPDNSVIDFVRNLK